jgi:hypothetical protein
MHAGLPRGTVAGDFEQFTCEIGKGELLGDEITGIIVAYNKAAAAGSYTAYFDDILITTDDINTSIENSYLKKTGNRIFIENNVLNFKNFPTGSDVVIYTVTGTATKSFKLYSNRVPVNLPAGIYIVTTKSERSVYSQKIVIGR